MKLRIFIIGLLLPLCFSLTTKGSGKEGRKSVTTNGSEKEGRMSCCSALCSAASKMGGDAVYKITKKWGRSDYLHLARTNASWFMRKKIEHEKGSGDFDRYRLVSSHTVNGEPVRIYRTPLHDAIAYGNVEVIRVLCAAGADAEKPIKDEITIQKSDLSQEKGITDTDPVDKDYKYNSVERLKKSYSVGGDAFQQARETQKLLDNACLSSGSVCFLNDNRPGAYDVLREFSKKSK